MNTEEKQNQEVEKRVNELIEKHEKLLLVYKDDAVRHALITIEQEMNLLQRISVKSKDSRSDTAWNIVQESSILMKMRIELKKRAGVNVG